MSSFVVNATTPATASLLPRWLLVSLALHLLLLLVWLPVRSGPAVAPEPTRLDIRLNRTVTATGPVAAPQADRQPRRPTAAPETGPAVSGPVSGSSPTSETELSRPPGIDLDAAMGTARRYGREPPPRRLPTDPVEKLLTVEAAVARATEPDVIVEKRGNAGEYIVEGKHFRCVQALNKPHYLQGMMTPALCTSKR